MATMADFGNWLGKRGNADLMLKVYQLEESVTVDKNATLALISSLVFAESKSVRTSTVILASFNVVAAFATAFSILYDSHFASKIRSRGLKSKFSCISSMHPAETFPLVLAIGIMLQGIIFAASQSIGLSSIFVDGCATVSQVVFPAIFLVPYIQLVFGVECLIRSFRTSPFQPRGKFDVSICLGVITLMVVGTWVPTFLRPEGDHCFASLVWFVTRYRIQGLITTCAVMGLSIVTAAIIFYRLSTVSLIDQSQRIAASRMVYYLVLGVVSLTFVIPWFVTLTMQNPTLITSMMATVVLNLSGLMTGLLQLFLRSNTATTSFKPKGTPGWSRGQHEIRIWGPNELQYGSNQLQQSSSPWSPVGSTNSRNSLFGSEKYRSMSVDMDSLRSPPCVRSPRRVNQIAAHTNDSFKLPSFPEPAAGLASSSPGRGHARKGSYSLFPPGGGVNTIPTRNQFPSTTFSNVHTKGDEFSISRDVESVYSDEGLLPPPPLHFIGNSSRHRRDSSMVSSATVQIGLRLSHAMSEDQPALPSTSYAYQRPASQLPRIQTQNLTPPRPAVRSPISSGTALRNMARAAEVLSPPAETNVRMKTLPPVPNEPRTSVQSQIQLSSTVYSPVSAKKSSPASSPTSSQSSAASPGRLKESRSNSDWI